MAKTVIARLPDYRTPWVWALRLGNVEPDDFQAVIVSLKVNIPTRARKWEPTSKRWLFHSDSIEMVEHILQLYGVSFDYEGKPVQNPDASLNREQAAAELYLLPNAPADVVVAVYRTLAKQYHPDHGGDLVKMQKLNAAVEVLK